jgi:hypothetical protein
LDLIDNAVALHTTATAHNHGRWSSNGETGDSRNGTRREDVDAVPVAANGQSDRADAVQAALNQLPCGFLNERLSR